MDKNVARDETETRGLILPWSQGGGIRPVKLPDFLRRAIRTFIDAFVGVLAIALVPALNDLVQNAVSGDGSTIELDLNLYRNILLAACVAGVISLITLVKNWAEDNTSFPSVLKANPSAGQNPVTVDPPK